MATGITPRLPLNIGDEGDFSLVKGYEELVKQNLKNILLTIPGERPMDSNFGVGIQRFLFEPNLGEIYGEMEDAISSQVEQYMPFVELQDIDIAPDANNEQLIGVRVYYVITPLDLEDTLVLAIENSGLL